MFDLRRVSFVVLLALAASLSYSVGVLLAASPSSVTTPSSQSHPASGVASEDPPASSGPSAPARLVDDTGFTATTIPGWEGTEGLIPWGGPTDVAVNPVTDQVLIDDGALFGLSGATCGLTDTNGCTIPPESDQVGALHESSLVVDTTTNTVYEANALGVQVLASSCFGSGASDCSDTFADQNSVTALALDEGTHTLYAVGPDAIDVIDTTTCNGAVTSGCAETCNATICTYGPPDAYGGGLVGALATEGRMSGIAVDQATDTLYAANSLTDLVSVYDAENCNAGQTGGCSPSDNVYCSSVNTTGCPPTVGQIDLGSSSYPTAVAVNQTTNTVYVADSGYETGIVDRVGGGSTVSVINGTNCSAFDDSGCSLTPPTVTVGTTPSGVAINEATNTVYVLNKDSATVSAIDGSTCDGADTSGCGGSPLTVTIGPDLVPDAIAVNSTTGSVYVTDFGTETSCNNWSQGGQGACFQGGSLSVFGPNGPATPPTAGPPPSGLEPLVVNLSSGGGTASGTVTSQPAGISCTVGPGTEVYTGTCFANFAIGTQVILTEAQTSGTIFEGWNGNGGGGPLVTTTSMTVVIPSTEGGITENAYFDPVVMPISSSETAGATPAEVGVQFLIPAQAFTGIPFTIICQWSMTASDGSSVATSDAACSYNPDNLVPGVYTVTMTATVIGTGQQLTQTLTEYLLPSVDFTWSIAPTSGTATTVPVTLDACSESIGVAEFAWTVSGTSYSGYVAGCEVTLNLPVNTGYHETTISLEGYDQQLTYSASASALVGIFSYAINTGNCDVVALGSNACWRQDFNWAAAVLGGTSRPPDYIVLQASGGVPGFAGSVDVAMTCDGNLYAGAGFAASLGTDDLFNFQVAVAWGWVGNPSAPEPSQEDIDSFVNGVTTSYGASVLVEGMNFISSPFASGPHSGIEYIATSPSINFTAAANLNVAGQGDISNPTGYCLGGVMQTPEFQNLTDVPITSNTTGYREMSPTTGGTDYQSSSPISPGQKLYLTASGFDPGSQVSATLHSTPVSLGTTDADDTGAIGFVVTIPSDTPPGDHTIILTGFAPEGSAMTETASITVAQPLSIGSSNLPNGQVGSRYSYALGASGGSLPYTWSVTAGHLPAGLTLNRTTGTISGKPTASGTSTFSVTVTDSTSPTFETSTASFSIAITKVGPAGVVPTSNTTSVPVTGAEVLGPGLAGLLAVLLGGLLLVAGVRFRRTRVS